MAKKPAAKPPAAAKKSGSARPAPKPAAPSPAPAPRSSTYVPQPLQGIGRAPFRYPPQ
jgi:hypothetical protein